MMNVINVLNNNYKANKEKTFEYNVYFDMPTFDKVYHTDRVKTNYKNKILIV